MSQTFQRILIKARLARDPQIKYIGNGQPVCNFNVIVNKEGKGDLIPCVAWGEKAKKIAEEAGQGDLLLFEAEIVSSSYESDEKGKQFYVKLQVLNDTEKSKSILQVEKKKSPTEQGGQINGH